MRDTLSIYSAKDIAHMTTDEGIVTADCQFCGAHYEFDPNSLGFEATVDADGQPIAQDGREDGDDDDDAQDRAAE